MFIFLIIGLLVGALVIIFAVQNIATVDAVFLTWHFEGSLALILVLAVVAGMIISSLLSLPDSFKKKFQISKLKDTNVKLQDELITKKMRSRRQLRQTHISTIWKSIRGCNCRTSQVNNLSRIRLGVHEELFQPSH